MNKLSRVSKLFIEFANNNKISLAAEFGSQEAYERFIVAMAIKALTDAGVQMSVAFDAVLGDGEYKKISEEIFAINSK
jgi:hypothetical protein